MVKCLIVRHWIISQGVRFPIVCATQLIWSIITGLWYYVHANSPGMLWYVKVKYFGALPVTCVGSMRDLGETNNLFAKFFDTFMFHLLLLSSQTSYFPILSHTWKFWPGIPGICLMPNEEYLYQQCLFVSVLTLPTCFFICVTIYYYYGGSGSDKCLTICCYHDGEGAAT